MKFLSELVKMSQGSAVPKWLHDYLVENRRKIAAELQLTGRHEIKTPSGDTITISVEK